MRAVYLAGRGLVSTLGLDLPSALAAIAAPPPPVRRVLPGSLNGTYPFQSIPSPIIPGQNIPGQNITGHDHADWNERARHLIQQVMAEAGADNARRGALFIATSSFDIGAIGRGASELDFHAYSEKIAGWLNWQGPVYVVSTACTSSLNALLAAHALLQGGEVDEAVVLGIELDNPLTLSGFAALQLLSPHSCQPFGAARDGLVLGEAVVALRLSCEPARWRVAGGANVVDGSTPTGASVHAVATMCRRALLASNIEATEIDLIKVQAAGSPVNDAAEAAGLHEVFHTLPPLLSLKAIMGHTLGASGAAEIALLTACHEHGLWPTCASETDSALNVTLADCAPEKLRYLLAIILGFGGGHTALVLEQTKTWAPI